MTAKTTCITAKTYGENGRVLEQVLEVCHRHQSEQSSPIVRATVQLNTTITCAHAREALTTEDVQALTELAANILAVVPRQAWMESYLKDAR